MITVEKGNTIMEGIDNMINAMQQDFSKCRYATGTKDYEIKPGKKYIKVIEKRGSVSCFVVNTKDDKKFKYGDVLKPSSWSTPARNKARGNVLVGGFPIQWTGPLYL